MPPKESTGTVTESGEYPVLIGSRIEKTLTVKNEQGNSRALISYKAALEILVVAFLSTDCPDDQTQWGKLRHFEQDYKDWKVAFVAVNAGSAGSTPALRERLDKLKLSHPVVEDDTVKLREAFRVNAAPTLLIFDEGGYLRYRGPLGKPARTALEALISHINTVADPEPANTAACTLP